MKINKYFVIDFDSTFTKVEAFDVLADISLNGHPDKEERKKKIVAITNQGMDGSISFRESLEQRLNLLSPAKQHLPILISQLRDSVSESFKRNKDFFERFSDNIYIISNGFKEFIEPIVRDWATRRKEKDGDASGHKKETVGYAFDFKAQQAAIELLRGLHIFNGHNDVIESGCFHTFSWRQLFL